MLAPDDIITQCRYGLVSKNGPTRPLLSFIFGLFKQTSIQFLQLHVKKCPSNIWCRDSNPQPSEHESPPITTRPGLPLKVSFSLRAFEHNYFLPTPVLVPIFGRRYLSSRQVTSLHSNSSRLVC